MLPETTDHDGRACSFCAKPEAEATKLVAGPGVNICTDCVDLAASIVAEYRPGPTELRMPMWSELTDAEMLERLPRVAALADQIEADLRMWVTELRRRGVTWAGVGRALGITRQSAWERFSGER
ncbi:MULTISPECIES: ClpX C4-type zinc finger protein [unclassified Streptomyces]|uniref:ClpX C4-type zinc finger protein n=1 Tax=unclassified Streptomyces TaxID=2593676 RepID=UPI0006AF3959|nr:MULTISPECIES: ClpX C4-type zinc finger protein [unclassified Streptomyces]KOX17221.1 Clp protease ClpX [Streptomyces sp. NRRL F-6491]KOX49975.1 Clp protease ClpX [Streptomyces sp. NRRL F-6492]